MDITLRDLPTPPPGFTGWPWTEQTPDAAQTGDTQDWPRITIVTPSFNQAAFIEETIRSVLLQRYPNLEYIIIDGGSADGSVEIIRKYEKWLSYWVSEKDRGQSHAINKGFQRATGKLFNWLNSDDVLSPSALFHVASASKQQPGRFYAGGFRVCFEGRSSAARECAGLDAAALSRYWDQYFCWNQAAIFFADEIWKACGPLGEDFHFAMDYALYLKIAARFPVCYLPHDLAMFRLHQSSKTAANAERFLSEVSTAAEEHWPPQAPKPDFDRVKRAYFARYYSGAAKRALLNRDVKGFLANLKKSCGYSTITTLKRFLPTPRKLALEWKRRRRPYEDTLLD